MNQPQLSILVVEDDSVTRETVGSVLEEEGYRVVLARNGAEALLAVAEDKPDLVLTDMNMPGLDGLAVLGGVRARHPDLPVVMFTADQTANTEREARRLGADDFISKPFNLDDMLSRIAACVIKN
jgi:CheY-like chemotaxis protein